MKQWERNVGRLYMVQIILRMELLYVPLKAVTEQITFHSSVYSNVIGEYCWHVCVVKPNSLYEFTFPEHKCGSSNSGLVGEAMPASESKLCPHAK